MKIAIMQPYFFPYIGYFQLINCVDEFIVYDDIKFTKKGWINRNRILVNNRPFTITLPLKKDSDSKMIFERCLSDSFISDRDYLLRLIKENYRHAPYYKEVYQLIETCLNFNDHNLFPFIFNTIRAIVNYLEIDTTIFISSNVGDTNKLKCENRVIEICKIKNVNIYVNPIGGIELYNKNDFARHGIDLYYLKTKEIAYKQFNNEFIPNLSIIDVMMFNSKEEIHKMLNEYELL